jgi:hypothetical protein
MVSLEIYLDFKSACNNDLVTNHKYEKILKKYRHDYNSWKPIYSEILKETIYFNSKGFNHLRFKINNTARSNKESTYKLRLLPLVRPVIYNFININSYTRRIAPIGGSKNKVLKNIEYWSIIAVVGKNKSKIKVILRRIGDGKIHFWSVMKLK